MLTDINDVLTTIDDGSWYEAAAKGVHADVAQSFGKLQDQPPLPARFWRYCTAQKQQKIYSKGKMSGGDPVSGCESKSKEIFTKVAARPSLSPEGAIQEIITQLSAVIESSNYDTAAILLGYLSVQKDVNLELLRSTCDKKIYEFPWLCEEKSVHKKAFNAAMTYSKNQAISLEGVDKAWVAFYLMRIGKKELCEKIIDAHKLSNIAITTEPYPTLNNVTTPNKLKAMKIGDVIDDQNLLRRWAKLQGAKITLTQTEEFFFQDTNLLELASSEAADDIMISNKFAYATTFSRFYEKFCSTRKKRDEIKEVKEKINASGQEAYNYIQDIGQKSSASAASQLARTAQKLNDKPLLLKFLKSFATYCINKGGLGLLSGFLEELGNTFIFNTVLTSKDIVNAFHNLHGEFKEEYLIRFYKNCDEPDTLNQALTWIHDSANRAQFTTKIQTDIIAARNITNDFIKAYVTSQLAIDDSFYTDIVAKAMGDNDRINAGTVSTIMYSKSLTFNTMLQCLKIALNAYQDNKAEHKSILSSICARFGSIKKDDNQKATIEKVFGICKIEEALRESYKKDALGTESQNNTDQTKPTSAPSKDSSHIKESSMTKEERKAKEKKEEERREEERKVKEKKEEERREEERKVKEKKEEERREEERKAKEKKEEERREEERKAKEKKEEEKKREEERKKYAKASVQQFIHTRTSPQEFLDLLNKHKDDTETVKCLLEAFYTLVLMSNTEENAKYIAQLLSLAHKTGDYAVFNVIFQHNITLNVIQEHKYSINFGLPTEYLDSMKNCDNLQVMRQIFNTFQSHQREELETQICKYLQYDANNKNVTSQPSLEFIEAYAKSGLWDGSKFFEIIINEAMNQKNPSVDGKTVKAILSSVGNYGDRINIQIIKKCLFIALEKDIKPFSTESALSLNQRILERDEILLSICEALGQVRKTHTETTQIEFEMLQYPLDQALRKAMVSKMSRNTEQRTDQDILTEIITLSSRYYFRLEVSQSIEALQNLSICDSKTGQSLIEIIASKELYKEDLKFLLAKKPDQDQLHNALLMATFCGCGENVKVILPCIHDRKKILQLRTVLQGNRQMACRNMIYTTNDARANTVLQIINDYLPILDKKIALDKKTAINSNIYQPKTKSIKPTEGIKSTASIELKKNIESLETATQFDKLSPIQKTALQKAYDKHRGTPYQDKPVHFKEFGDRYENVKTLTRVMQTNEGEIFNRLINSVNNTEEAKKAEPTKYLGLGIGVYFQEGKLYFSGLSARKEIGQNLKDQEITKFMINGNAVDISTSDKLIAARNSIKITDMLSFKIGDKEFKNIKPMVITQQPDKTLSDKGELVTQEELTALRQESAAQLTKS